MIRRRGAHLTRRRSARLNAVLLVAALVAGSAVGSGAARADVAAGQDYHVDCSKHAAGDGTVAAPWNSLNQVDAVGAFQPGDRILFLRGTTCKGRLHPNGQGRPGAPITVSAYGSGARPTIAGGGTGNGTGAVHLRNQHDWTVQYLHITNHSAAKTTKRYRSAVLVENVAHGRLANIRLQHLTIDGVTSNPTSGFHGPRLYGGISVLTYGHAKDGFTGLQVLDNTISHVARTGIAVANTEYAKGWDSGARISGNRVTKAKGDSILLWGASSGRIDHNVSADGASFWPCPQCKRVSPETANAGIWTAHSKHIRIDHNEVYGEHAKGGDGTGFDIDQSAVDTVLEQNYSHDNEGGGLTICGAKNATVRFNIFENNPRFATLTCHPRSKNVQIYNNTIYAAASAHAKYVIFLRPGYAATGLTFVNNVVYSGSSGAWRLPSGVRFADNILVGAHAWSEPVGTSTSRSSLHLKRPGRGGNGIGTLSGYHRTRSQLHGVAIPKSATTDFFGHRVNPKKPYRGASGTV